MDGWTIVSGFFAHFEACLWWHLIKGFGSVRKYLEAAL